MITDRIELGPAPAEEQCAQTNADDYPERSRIECRVWAHQLNRTSPPPTGAGFAMTSNQHDYGVYREVAATYDPSEMGAMNWALNIEDNLPTEWDREACEQLVAALSKAGLDIPDDIATRALPEPEEQHDILCGCGWGQLGMKQSLVDELIECPNCGRAFSAEWGWQ